MSNRLKLLELQNLQSRSPEALETIQKVLDIEDLLGYIITFFPIDPLFRVLLTCKSYYSKNLLRHVRVLSRYDWRRARDVAIMDVVLKHIEKFTGLREIDWYFDDTECQPFKEILLSIAPQIERFSSNNAAESRFLQLMNPKIVKSLDVTEAVPESFLLRRLPNLEELSIAFTTAENAKNLEFACIQKSLEIARISALLDDDLDTDVLADYIRRIAASNPNLKQVSLILWQRDVYKLTCRLLLGNQNSADVFPDKVDGLNDICMQRLGVPPQAILINFDTLWSIFYLCSPTSSLKEAKDASLLSPKFSQTPSPTHERFYQVSRFIQRLHDPEMLSQAAHIDSLFAEVEKALDALLESESPFCPLFNTEDIAVAILHWGGMMLLRHGDDAEVRQRVAAKCRLTIEHTPNLLSVCDIDRTLDSSIHAARPGLLCVLELGGWFDPKTMLVKETSFDMLCYHYELLLALAVHPKFNPDVLIDENEYLCGFMLQSLLECYVPPDVSHYDASFLALAKMCVERNLKLKITSSISSFSLGRFFVSDEMLDLFSILADDVRNLANCDLFAKTKFGMSETLFRGIALILARLEERSSPAGFMECREVLSNAIWDSFRNNDISFIIYEPKGRWIEHVFEIFPKIPDAYAQWLEGEGEASRNAREIIVRAMYSVGKLRRLLPPKARARAAAQGNKEPL